MNFINKNIRIIAALALLMNLGFIITFILIQVTNPELNWMRYPLSRYYYEPDGYILVTGLFLIGICEILTAGLIYSENTSKNRWLAIIVLFMGISAFLIAVFPMNLFPEKSLHGFIHMVAAAFQFFLFPISTIGYGFLKGRSNFNYFHIFYGIASSLILMNILRILLTLEPTEQNFYGLFQKIYILLIVIWLAIISMSKISQQLQNNQD